MSKGSSVKIPSDYTIKLGSDGSTIHVDSDLDNIHVKEIAPVTINSNLAVTKPIVTDSTSKSDSTANIDLKVEPLKVSSDSTSAIDVKPLAIDSCQTLKLAPLPPIKLEQPYSQHFGITFMGMELWGFNVSGKSDTFLHSPPKARHFSTQTDGQRGTCDCCGEPADKSQSAPSGHRSGLRVRVK